jgi:hypothetical protein
VKTELDRAEQRARQYWYDDGLTEIGVAILFLAIGALFLVEALAPAGSLPASFSAIGLVVLVAGGIWIINWAVRLAKRRITYPRTGFVRYPRRDRSPRRRLLVGVLGATVSMVIVLVLFATAPASLAWIPALQGAFIGAFILYVAYVVGLIRFYLLAAASFGLGLATALAGLGDTLGNGVYFAGMGLALLLSGVVTLLRYLKSTEPPEGGVE